MTHTVQSLAYKEHPEMLVHFSPELVPLHLGASWLGPEDIEACCDLRIPEMFKVEV